MLTKNYVMSRKVIAMALAMMLLFTVVLAGCSKKTDEPNATQAPATQAPGEATPEATQEPNAANLPLTTKPVTLSIATMDFGIDKSLSNDMAVIKKIQENTGITIDWQVVTPAEYKTTMETRLAAGSKMACMVQMPSDPVKYATGGVIIPLNDLIEKHTVYLKQFLKDHPALQKQYTAPDGNMYTLPMIAQTAPEESAKYNHMAFLIRRDWLKTLKLEVPKTVDEFHDVLVAFRDRDPNGNKIKDEIPYSAVNAPGVPAISPFGWMYGLHLQVEKGFYPDANGKIVYEYTSHAMKELLVLMNKWFSEGLIDPGYITLDGQKWNAQLFSNIAGSTAFFSMAPGFGYDSQVQTSSKNPEAGFLVMPSPTVPNYKPIIESFAVPGSDHFAITKNCEDPVLAIKWLDYATYSPDGFAFNMYGVKGLTYDMVDGKPKLLDSITKTPDGQTIELQRFGGYHNAQFPIVASPESSEFTFGAQYSKLEYGKELFEQLSRSPKPVPVLTTKEEAETIARLMPDIETYTDEMVAKFVTGAASIDQFDSFVKKIEELGIKDVLAIKQQQNDR